ncbi:MAG TPA: Tat pathway signal protein [Candidatus Ratteibacteria bacterium]|nr:Tat pathway signal protein [bacterium]HPC29290.1 Tat pathway signal protein [bacterium]HRS06950.1 Tat pathway signal protein [Candidatus Ratteibacteria bacterium]HRV05058.1 Tat pathway signal protein [Candidatus Ratteibacteria bacterium]
MMWAYLIHLGFNMWEEQDAKPLYGMEKGRKRILDFRRAQPYLRFDEELWNELLREMKKIGINMLVIDLGEGVQYESHPEISVKGSWSVKKLKQEIGKLRSIGIEPIPKLNFSTTHDTWLGPYSRCVSTDLYYGVCRDLINEVCSIFDRPRFFHLGMDEETAGHQRFALYAVMRQHQLWWDDLYFLINEVEKSGVRPWVWADYLWHHPDIFFKKMPKSVLQSNWYYGRVFSLKINYVRAYLDLEKYGYDQIPTGSICSVQENLEKTVSYCSRRISRERLFGFLQTVWRPTIPSFRRKHLNAIKAVSKAKNRFEK